MVAQSVSVDLQEAACRSVDEIGQEMISFLQAEADGQSGYI
jgi:hypothetical protein